MSDNNKPKGIYFNEPIDNAPDFVDGDINIKVDDFIGYLNNCGTKYVKLDILKGQYGRYLKLNTFQTKLGVNHQNDDKNYNKKNEKKSGNNNYSINDDVPF